MGSKAGSASKVKLNSFDDLFGGAENTSGEQIISAKLSDLHTFKGHPFRVLDDEKMEETTESISKYGVLVPGLARPRAEGGYEIIAGHRRKRGSERAGLDTMPVIVRNYTDDEATIIMVDSNIQREDILPSEKAVVLQINCYCFFTLLNPIYDITQNIDSFLLILVLQIIWVLSHNLQVNNRQVNLPVPSIIIVFNRCYCIYNTNGIDPV